MRKIESNYIAIVFGGQVIILKGGHFFEATRTIRMWHCITKLNENSKIFMEQFEYKNDYTINEFTLEEVYNFIPFDNIDDINLETFKLLYE